MSSNDQQHQDSGGWEPIPQSEGYDGDATAFVQLPPDFMLDGVPLEAPGHGYVPPMITPLQPLNPGTDPAATGTWTVHVPTQAEQTQYFDGAGAGAGAGAGYAEYAGPEYPEYPGYTEQRPESFGRPGQAGQSGYSEQIEQIEHGEHLGYVQQDPHATAEWRFTEPAAPAGPGATGQWQIPALPDTEQAPEATDEFAASAVRPYAEAPATLPGGAPAPWVLAEDERAGEAGADDEPAATAVETAPGGTPADGAEAEPAAAGATAVAPGHAPEHGPGLVPDRAPDFVPGPRSDSATGHTPEPGADLTPDPTADDLASDPEVTPEPTADLAPELAPDLTPSANVHASTDSDEHPHTSYTLRVNGVDRPVTGSWIGESLLYVLRERLGLAGAKDGCSQGECGACNVQVDGRLVASCLVPAATAAESEVRTVEGLATDGEPSDVQRAMAKCGTVQCGFCIPGMCMTVHDLLEGNHAPTELETRQALAGNLCRCSGYRGVLEAVRDVVAEREASAAATAADGADGPRVPHQIPHPHDGGMA